MKKQQIENPPAFPEIFTDEKHGSGGDSFGDVYSVGGMTLRDYFAAKAMQGILSNAANYGQGGILESGQPAIAKAAYEIAAEMLKVRASK